VKVLDLDVDAVVFDLDGTLLDSERAITEAAAAAFAEIDARVSALQVADHLGAPLEELFAIFVGAPASDADHVRMRKFIVRYIEIHDEHPDRFPPPLPGVREGLTALHARGVKLAVATTKPSERARSQLEGTGLLALFTHVQGTDAGMRPKPAPDVVVRACAGLAVPCARAIMIGDTHRDVAAALAAGAHAAVVAYTDAQAHAAKPWGAHAIVRTLRAL
jgi:AHBA synthesis associated protein